MTAEAIAHAGQLLQEAKGKDVRIAVAYMSKPGAERLRDAKPKSAELIIGLDDAVTDPDGLELAGKQKHWDVRVVPPRQSGGIFHPKVFWIRSGKGGAACIGSANLTDGGLRANQELGLLVRHTSSRDLPRGLSASWDGWWDKAIPLAKLDMKAYRTWHASRAQLPPPLPQGRVLFPKKLEEIPATFFAVRGMRWGGSGTCLQARPSHGVFFGLRDHGDSTEIRVRRDGGKAVPLDVSHNGRSLNIHFRHATVAEELCEGLHAQTWLVLERRAGERDYVARLLPTDSSEAKQRCKLAGVSSRARSMMVQR